jgi:hypothetical protein
MTDILAWIALLFPQPVMVGPVAVHAAYVIHTQQADTPAKECCGECQGGFITHGDGHKTPCPCPPDCKCKATKSVLCPDGKCEQKK